LPNKIGISEAKPVAASLQSESSGMSFQECLESELETNIDNLLNSQKAMRILLRLRKPNGL